MRNCYHVIGYGDRAAAEALAPDEGAPNELFQPRYDIHSPHVQAIVQANWADHAAISALGDHLGDMLGNGSAEQSVFDFLAAHHADWYSDDI